MKNEVSAKNRVLGMKANESYMFHGLWCQSIDSHLWRTGGGTWLEEFSYRKYEWGFQPSGK